MYDNESLQKLIADVTSEFTAHLAKAEDSFKAKKDDSEKEEPKEESKEESKESPEHEAKESPFEEKEEHKEEPKSEESKEEEKPSEEPKDEAGHGYDDEDLSHMEQMYSSMSPAELKAHHDAVRKCLDAHGAQSQPAPEAAPAPEMAKSEKDVVVEDKEVALLKSENEDLKKNLDAVTAFLAKFVEKTAPAGKAITSLDIIAKSSGGIEEKPLQKSEIDAKLTAKAKETTLSKSDRDAINSYYCGSKNIETVRHLLK